MKKEIFALSLLALLFAASLFNIRYFDRLCLDLAHEINASSEALEAGNKAAAQEHLDAALDTWLDADSYTHIFIRHAEIDSTADAFYELQAQLLAGEGDSSAAYDKLRYHLDSIQRMEHPSLGSVL